MTDSAHDASKVERDLENLMAGNDGDKSVEPFTTTDIMARAERAVPTPAAKPAFNPGAPLELRRAIAPASSEVGRNEMITASTITADNNRKLSSLADEKKTVLNSVHEIDRQMNALLDQRRSAEDRLLEINRAEAIIGAAMVASNAPRWASH